MQSRQHTAHAHRDALLALGFGLLAVLQAGAFWMLCQSQVDKAQARDAQVRAERVADCLADPGASTHCPELVAQAGPARAEHEQTR